jgi:type III pantothenate kinase
MLLCIDIGNTHTHYGVVGPQGARFMQQLLTRQLDHLVEGLGSRLAQILADHPGVQGVAFCSVVPEASERLVRVLERWRLSLPVFQLTHEKKLGVAITYPRPAEIGQDRLANAAAAQVLVGAPAIVIDMGTAVTFDIVTRAGGYEGGIIAPGIEVMRRYLHEQTALLPKMEGDEVDVPRAIGKSTVEAMTIGTLVGFGGMVQALLAEVLKELTSRGEPNPAVLATGGAASLLKNRLRHPCEIVPDLTLRGLARAWQLNQ